MVTNREKTAGQEPKADEHSKEEPNFIDGFQEPSDLHGKVINPFAVVKRQITAFSQGLYKAA